MGTVHFSRRVRKAGRRLREARMLIRAFRSPYQPVAAHIIPIRRCNIACAYCNEYDDHSAPVPTDEMLRRIDCLAALGTGIVTLSGGEPLLHPELDSLICHIRARRMIATLITNGYLLSRDRITRLNRAGLDQLQISIDNVNPDGASKKSLRLLDQKLRWLAELRGFDVTVNTVVGSGVSNAGDALTIAQRARELGFMTTIGIIHDGSGHLVALDDEQRKILERMTQAGGSAFDYANYNRFQRNLANGLPNDWHCRAGSRYLYICEDGLVHWCSQQRGQPGIPLERYADEDLRREYHVEKGCAPFCTVGCVHRVAQVDELRQAPEETLSLWFAPRGGVGGATLPAPVRVLRWAFVTSPHRDLFRRAASAMFEPMASSLRGTDRVPR